MNYYPTLRWRHLAACVCLASALSAGFFVQTASAALSAADHVVLMGRGINLNSHLVKEPAAGGLWATSTDFQKIKDAGFNSVRIPVVFSPKADWTLTDASDPNDNPNNYDLDAAWLPNVDSAINAALSRGLVPILDFHGYGDGLETGIYSTWHVTRFVNLWKQIAERYRDYDEKLAFEILNEPRTNLTASVWNSIIPQVISAIRATGGGNATRNLVIDSVNYAKYDEVKNLVLPADQPNLIISFHYYVPQAFTHQGATWNNPVPPVGTQFGSSSDLANVVSHFNTVKTWATANNRPVFVGEFGVMNLADPLSRNIYANAVTEAAVARGFACAWWSMTEVMGVYDASAKKWDRSIVNEILGGAGEFRLRNANYSTMYLDPASTANWAAAQTKTGNTAAASQVWLLDRLSNRTFYLINSASAYALNAASATAPSLVTVGTWHSDWWSQRWNLSRATGTGLSSIYWLQDSYGTPAFHYLASTAWQSGSAVQSVVFNTGDNKQKWYLEPVWR